MKNNRLKCIGSIGPIDYWGGAQIADREIAEEIFEIMPEPPRGGIIGGVVYVTHLPNPAWEKMEPLYMCKADNNGTVYLFGSECAREAIEILNSGVGVEADLSRGPEPSHGKWVAYEGMQPPEFRGKHYCSECGHDLHLSLNGGSYNFCPNCGADMRGDSDK